MDDAALFANFSFSSTSTSPLYIQLAEFFRHSIRSGVLKPGDRMIAENDVVNLLKISRTTVRLAFDQLVDEGLIFRHRGKGTFVATPKANRSVNYLYSFTEIIRASGSVPSATIVHSEVVEAREDEKKMLHLSGDMRLFLIERIRKADNKPLVIEKTIIPYFLCPGIEHINFAEASLFATLRGVYNLNIVNSEQTIEAVILERDSCCLVDDAERLPGYKIDRMSYLDSGYVCEHTISLTRADMCYFHLDLNSTTQSTNIVLATKDKTSDPPDLRQA